MSDAILKHVPASADKYRKKAVATQDLDGIWKVQFLATGQDADSVMTHTDMKNIQRLLRVGFRQHVRERRMVQHIEGNTK